MLIKLGLPLDPMALERITSCQYQYDADSNLTQEEGDCEGDGTPNRLVTYEHEATGWGHIFAN